MANAKQYRYTVEEVAEAVGLSVKQVYYHVRRGRVDLDDIVSVSAYIVSERLRRECRT